MRFLHYNALRNRLVPGIFPMRTNYQERVEIYGMNELKSIIITPSFFTPQWKDVPMPDIFRYTDYRRYLKDTIKAMRKTDPSLSFRALAKHIGLLAPSHIFLVLQAKRNIGDLLLLRLSAF
jgi:hypothetical protein